MDEGDLFSETREPNRDELRARHIAELAFEFMNARHPVPTTQIWRSYYPETKRDSFSRSFLRDREDLARCGLMLEECQDPAGTPCWRVDEEASFAGRPALTQEDAFVLDIACAPLLSDPSFLYTEDLRMALAKIDRSFGGVPPLAMPTGVVATAPALSTVERAFDERRACEISYRDAHGRESTRTICTYGLYGLRQSVYVVAASPGKNGTCDDASIRNYNAGRILTAKISRTKHYEIPDDFDIDDHVFLPFQLGPTTLTGTFRVADEHASDLRREALGHGSLRRDGAGMLTWEVDVHDVAAAASWAVAVGIVPVSPAPLVDAWHDVLKGVLAHD